MPDSTPPIRDWPQVRLLSAVFRASTALREAHRNLFTESGIGMSEFDLLAALGNTDGLRMKDLAWAMITSPPCSRQ